MNEEWNSNNRQNFKRQWEKIKKKPWVSQALWLIPIFWAAKNLRDTLIIWKDSITDREFTTKEQLFKTLSGACALGSRWVALYNSYYDKDVLDTILLMSWLQIGNRTSYITGVYYSWELQKILQQHKENVSQHTQKIISTTQSTTKKITNATKWVVKKHTTRKKKDTNL